VVYYNQKIEFGTGFTKPNDLQDSLFGLFSFPNEDSFIHSFVSLIMPPTTRNGHTTSNHYKQKPNPKLKIIKIHEMHIAHKT